MKKGFTLSEIILAILIIGIISMLTVPHVTDIYKERRLKVQKQKAINTITNGYKQMLTINGSSNLSDLPLLYCENPECFAYEHNKIFKINTDSLSDIIVDIFNNQNYYNAAYALTFEEEYRTSNYDYFNVDWGKLPYSFITADGMIFGLKKVSNKDNIYINLIVDTNCAKKPNQVGKDYLEFIIDKKANIIDVTENVSSNNNFNDDYQNENPWENNDDNKDSPNVNPWEEDDDDNRDSPNVNPWEEDDDDNKDSPNVNPWEEDDDNKDSPNINPWEDDDDNKDLPSINPPEDDDDNKDLPSINPPEDDDDNKDLPNINQSEDDDDNNDSQNINPSEEEEEEEEEDDDDDDKNNNDVCNNGNGKGHGYGNCKDKKDNPNKGPGNNNGHGHDLKDDNPNKGPGHNNGHGHD